MNTGDAVYWTLRGRDSRIIERAGHIVCVLEGEQHPNSAGFGEVVNPTSAVRIDTSYLVKLPQGTIMWPYNVSPLPEDKQHLLAEQAVVTVKKSCIDKRDRLKLKLLAKKLGHDFMESDHTLSVPEWGKRFLFEVDTVHGVEYISSIEVIKV